MIWMDRRAEAEIVRLAELIGAEEIYRVTGNRPDAFYVAARLLWLRDHEPEVLKQTWKFVQVNGFINYRLTGRVAMDPAHAVLSADVQLLHGCVVCSTLLRLRGRSGAVPRGNGGYRRRAKSAPRPPKPAA